MRFNVYGRVAVTNRFRPFRGAVPSLHPFVFGRISGGWFKVARAVSLPAEILAGGWR